MVTCFLGIGSNLGNRHKNIEMAVKKINVLKETKVIKLSTVIETQPEGVITQPKFLNSAAKIITSLPPKDLLKQLKRIERELGRIKSLRWGPRTIDLDILFYGDKIIRSKALEVPHPRMREREFVLKPLLEII